MPTGGTCTFASQVPFKKVLEVSTLSVTPATIELDPALRTSSATVLANLFCSESLLREGGIGAEEAKEERIINRVEEETFILISGKVGRHRCHKSNVKDFSWIVKGHISSFEYICESA